MKSLSDIVRDNERAAAEMERNARLADNMIVWDEHSFKQTLAVLEVINPGPKNEPEFVKSLIRRNFKPGAPVSVATGGWQASSFIDWEGKVCVRLTLTPYTVARHLNGGKSPYDGAGRVVRW